ncbi:class I SAM-dependent methyltransferase [Nocardioides aestuarii]|uniref:Methyltransferase domain-containing protein n=1 Tax=Nocardioides aestuarii TaxID=252231 RepID=A0ABW4TTX4_9ACTN
MSTRHDGLPFTEVFSRALQGLPCHVLDLGADGPVGVPRLLPVADWTRRADHHDDALLALCDGPTLDIGCGPGRLVERLVALGHVALGIDVVPEAVAQTVRRGAAALHRNVFDALPGEGRWGTALLADGNIGIGGDPVALLSRVRQLLDPRGRVVVELGAPGTGLSRTRAVISCDGVRSRPFEWAVVGMDAAPCLAAEVGLQVSATHTTGERFYAVLEEAA